MKRLSIVLLMFASVLFAKDYLHELKAYLTSKIFDVNGMMYSYDFNKNGYIEYNEWIYVSQKSGKMFRLLGTTPTENNAFGFSPVDVNLEGFTPVGYFCYIDFPGDLDKRFSWVYLHINTGKIYKLMGVNKNHFFQYLTFSPGAIGLSDLTFQIDNQKLSFVYKNQRAFSDIVSSYDTTGYSWNIAVSEGDKAYIADGDGGLYVLEIGGISLYYPNLYTHSNITPIVDVALDIEHNRLYAAKNSQEIVVFNANTLEQIGVIQLPESHEIVQLALSDDKKALFALDGLHSVYIIDVSSANYPVIKRLNGEFSYINIYNNKLYIVDSSKGVCIYSLKEDACKPCFKKELTISGLNSAVPSADGSMLYASAYGSTKLYLLHTDPGKMHLNKSIENHHEICKVVVDNKRHKLYTLNEVASIDVYDITQKDEPRYIKTIYLPYPALDMQISSSGKLGYLANGGDGFKIIRLLNY